MLNQIQKTKRILVIALVSLVYLSLPFLSVPVHAQDVPAFGTECVDTSECIAGGLICNTDNLDPSTGKGYCAECSSQANTCTNNATCDPTGNCPIGSGPNDGGTNASTVSGATNQTGAGNPGTGGPGAGLASYDFVIDNPIGVNTLQDLIALIGTYIFNISIPIAVIVIVYGGIMMLLGGYDPKYFTAGKTALTNAVIALAVILIGRGFVALIQSIIALKGS